MRNKKNNLFSRILNNQKGVSAILVAIVLPVLLGFTALAIDVGYMYATKNELQNIADAAALAGASELGRIYLAMDQDFHFTYEPDGVDKAKIRKAAKDVAAENKAAGVPILIGDSDISIGKWDIINVEFKEPDGAIPGSEKGPDAVRVKARRDSSEIGNGAVATFFARIFSIFGGSHETFESYAVATAALSGIGTVAEGILKAPFGISEHHDCNQPKLELSPTISSCAGWHNFDDDNISGNALENKMIGIIRNFGPVSDGVKTEGDTWLEDHFTIKENQLPDGVTTNETVAGEAEFIFQGGNVESLFLGGVYQSWDWTTGDGVTVDDPTPVDPTGNLDKPAPFITLFDFFRFRDGDGSETDTLDFCGEVELADNVWSTTVPIYQDGGGCSNPNQTRVIVGFANVMIRMPNPIKPNNEVEVCYDCNSIVELGRGSGNNLGNVKGSIPNLVQ